MIEHWMELRDGSYWIKTSNVSLDSIIYAFISGDSPENIAGLHPSSLPADVHRAITFYLSHQSEVNRYLAPKHLANSLKASASKIASNLVQNESMLFRSLNNPWIEPQDSCWVDTLFQEYRYNIDLRTRFHTEGLLALAGVIEARSDHLDHLADWLRLHCYLYAELSPRYLETIRNCFQSLLQPVGGLNPTEYELAIYEIEKSLLDETIVTLYEELIESIACFDSLRQLRTVAPSNNSSPQVVELYWDASARLAPLFAIDWNSFGREDLFDNNGLRAASWLKEQGFAKPDSHTLQIGCGIGRVERHLASLVNHAYGVDLSEEMLQIASNWLRGIDNITLLKTDGQRLPLPDESIDTVFSFLVFIHISSPSVWQALFIETYRVLRLGGYFLFTFESEATAETCSSITSLAQSVGLTTCRVGPVNSRNVNSFDPDWDLLFVFRKPLSSESEISTE